MAHEWWGYWDCIYPSLVYVTLKEFGVVGLDTYTWAIKDFHKCWSGSLAKRRLCLGPTGVINCTSLSALSFWVSLFPRMHGYNTMIFVFSDFTWYDHLHVFPCCCKLHYFILSDCWVIFHCVYAPHLLYPFLFW